MDLIDEVLSRQRGSTDARELAEELLGDPGERLRVARLLEPLYQDEGLWRDLCLVLRAQRELSDAPAEAAELLARVAAVEEEKLSHERAAFDTWREVLVLLPADERARQHVARLGAVLGLWAETVAAFESAFDAVAPTDLSARVALLTEVAQLSERHLADPVRAMDAHRRLLETDPQNPDIIRLAGGALDRLYQGAAMWAELMDIIRRQAEWSETVDERIQFLVRLAELEEIRAGDTARAMSTWREVLAEDPEEPRALDALERLLSAGGQVRDLCDILRRRIELSGDPDDKKVHLARLAGLYERELDSAGEAVGAWLEVLDFLPQDIDALDQLARLYRAADRAADLLEVVERRLAVSEDSRERLALTLELGGILHQELGREGEALEHYATVLKQEPDQPVALARIESMLDDPELKLRAADVLLPLYESGGEWQKLADLLMRVAEAVGDPRSRLRHLRRVALIRERELGDRAGALAATREAAVAAVAEPDLPELLGELARLAAEQERLGDLIEVYQQIAPDVFDGDLQRRLYLDIADLARGVKHDDHLAARYYEMVLESQPDDRRAITALEGIHREAGDHDALYQVLIRKAELAAGDLEARAEALSSAAELCQTHLGRPEDALLQWEQVLELMPDSKAAAQALETLYQETERWHDLTDLIERRLGFAFTVDEAVGLRFRLGEICERHLYDPDRAVENYSAALGGEPGHAGARAALERYLDDAGTRAQAAEVLEPIYVAHQDWPRLVRIYEIKLEGAANPAERMQLERYIARLHEDQLEDLEGAFRWYGRLFRESPGEPGLRSQLVRLAGVLEGWDELANIYQEYLDDTPGEAPEVRDVALALAELCDRRLGEVERAHAAYRRVLQGEPDDVGTFARLEAMLTRGQRWYALVETYQDAIQASLDDGRRLDLYARMAATYEQRLGDLARAVDSHRAALDIDPSHRHALGELERLFQDQSQWFELAELLVARIDRAVSVEEATGLRLRLAELLETRLGDSEGAIDQYEKALETASVPGGHIDATALGALERLVVEEQHQRAHHRAARAHLPGPGLVAQAGGDPGGAARVRGGRSREGRDAVRDRRDPREPRRRPGAGARGAVTRLARGHHRRRRLPAARRADPAAGRVGPAGHHPRERARGRVRPRSCGGRAAAPRAGPRDRARRSAGRHRRAAAPARDPRGRCRRPGHPRPVARGRGQERGAGPGGVAAGRAQR